MKECRYPNCDCGIQGCGLPQIKSNNAPYSELQLEEEEHALLFQTCEANIRLGLNILQAVQDGTMSREAAERAIILMEGYKTIRGKLQKARPDHDRTLL